MELTQVLLFFVVIALTTMVLIIGWQIYQILVEIRKMLEKVNTAAQGAIDLTNHIERSLHSFSGVSDGIKSAIKLFMLFRPRGDEERKTHHG